MDLLASLPRPTLVLLAAGVEKADSSDRGPSVVSDWRAALAEAASAEPGADGVIVARLPITPPRPGGSLRSVVLVAPDIAQLRRAASVLPSTGRCRAVACLVAEAHRPIPPTLRPEWPRVRHLRAELAGGSAVTVLRFATGAPGAEVLAQVARDAGAIGGRARVAGSGGLVTAIVPSGADLPWLPADQQVRVAATASVASSVDIDVPPSVILTDETGVETPDHPVTGRPPVLVRAAPRDLAVGPLDEAVFNPRGFLRAVAASSGDGTLTLDGEAFVLRTHQGVEVRAERPSWPLIKAARPLRSVRIAWPDGADRPNETSDAAGGGRGEEADLRVARVVAALAMAGVPLVGAPLSGPAADSRRTLLGSDLAELLEAVPDLADPLRREEHSIRLRRAALTRHATLGWRRRYADRLGLRVAADPSVSVLLATRRPDLLPFALRQVGRQRLDAELVLTTHGFDADHALVAEILGDRPVTIRSLPSTAVFGSVLGSAAEAASGDVLVKFDDDDWYGPDVVDDLLLARRYSGADLVGMPAEFCYLEPIATTVRRRGPSEAFGRVVAGGTMMIDRATLRRVGGFRPVTRHVDAQLLAAVRAAGGSVYRTQGLGYLLRRAAGGHTWATSLGYFLSRQSVAAQWRGFQPSALVGWSDPDLAGGGR